MEDNPPSEYPFDEAWYLATYPDVSDAVADGSWKNGYTHFRLHGRHEGRFGSAEHEDAFMAACLEARTERVGSVWSVDVEQCSGSYWMAHPMVRERLNTLASGRPDKDAYDRLMEIARQRGIECPIARAVSLGCGFGGLERDLAARGVITEIDAYDIAAGAIAEARRLAREAGLHGLRYHVLDLDSEEVGLSEVDVVFAHQSVHHVEKLEETFAHVSAMLRPGGLFHLHEFVGPSRFQWTDAQIELVNRFLTGLPPRLRALPSGQPRPLQVRPRVAAMIAADPSEAIRSAEILPLLPSQFDIVEQRPLGGALLHLGLGDIVQNFDPARSEDREILQQFFTAEDAAMRDGVVGSDFVVIVAAKRAEQPV